MIAYITRLIAHLVIWVPKVKKILVAGKSSNPVLFEEVAYSAPVWANALAGRFSRFRVS